MISFDSIFSFSATLLCSLFEHTNVETKSHLNVSQTGKKSSDRISGWIFPFSHVLWHSCWTDNSSSSLSQGDGGRCWYKVHGHFWAIVSVCLSVFLSSFLSFSVSLWIVVWVTAWYVVVTNPPAPLAGSQCAGLFSTTVLGGSSSAPNLQDYARAHRKKFSTGSLSYKDGTCLRRRSFTNLHRATADQCLTLSLWYYNTVSLTSWATPCGETGQKCVL